MVITRRKQEERLFRAGSPAAESDNLISLALRANGQECASVERHAVEDDQDPLQSPNIAGMVGRRAAWLVFANRTKPLETGLRGCGCSADRTGLHGANSRLSGKRTGNFVNSRGSRSLVREQTPDISEGFRQNSL